MIRQVNKENMDADVILKDKVVKLSDLLPDPY